MAEMAYHYRHRSIYRLGCRTASRGVLVQRHADPVRFLKICEKIPNDAFPCSDITLCTIQMSPIEVQILSTKNMA